MNTPLKRNQPKRTKHDAKHNSVAKVASGKKTPLHNNPANHRLRRKRVSLAHLTGVVVFSGISVVGLVLWNGAPLNKGPLLSLELKNTDVSVGEPFVVQVYADSQDVKVNAIRSYIIYNPEQLRLDSVNANNGAYPIEAFIDSTSGSHEIVRAVVGGVSERQLVAEYTFVPLQAGEGTIAFDTEQTYLVEEVTNKNILDQKDFSNINIKVQ